MNDILFYLFGALTIAGGAGVLLSRNPISSAASLILTFLSIAVIFIMQSAHFIAVIQILIYAGAIMVLFVFIIMLVNLGREDLLPGEMKPLRFMGVVLSLFLGLVLITALHHYRAPSASRLPESFGTIEKVGELLFTRYLLPFEIISILLLSALGGAFILAKREK